jgi:hypothetical protein
MDSETQTEETPVAKSGANVAHQVRWLLAATMTLETLLVIGLTLRDFELATTLTATIGSVTLLAISGVGVWAVLATCKQQDGWLRASFLGQSFIAGLAGYTFLTDLRSPVFQPFVAVFACILGIIAIFWVFYLLAHRGGGPITAGMTTIVALIPLLGFVQFWLQTDYLPRTSLPLVDVTTDLTPTGKRGDIVQLEAKVTINNRSSVQVNAVATAMRITAYPWRPPGPPTQLPDAMNFGFTPSQEYRADPLPTDQGIPLSLYAIELFPPAYTLPAGQTYTFRRVVDFNSRDWRLARLAVDAIFITSPAYDGLSYTCALSGQPQKSAEEAKDEIDKLIKEAVAGGMKQFKCREIRLMPRNVIHEIIGNHITFEVLAIFNDPTNPGLQYPSLLLWWGVNGNYFLNARQSQRVSAENPTTSTSVAVEYSPSEESAPPGGGTPSTTQPPSATQPR